MEILSFSSYSVCKISKLGGPHCVHTCDNLVNNPTLLCKGKEFQEKLERERLAVL